MQKTFTLVSFFLGIHGAIFCQTTDFQSFEFFYRESKKSFEAKEYKHMLQYLQKADSLMENYPTILYQLAIAYLLNGQEEKACRTLLQLLRQDNSMAIEEDSSFFALRQKSCFSEVLREKEQLLLRIANSQVLSYALPYPDYHPDAIAFSAKEKTFWTGSIRRRNIGYWNKKGQFVEYIDETSGLYSILAMKFSKDGKTLWISTAAIPEMRGFRKDLEGRAQIIQLHKKSLSLKRYEVNDDEPHLFTDLALHPTTKEVFVLDGKQSTIYRIKPNQL
ncbi:MAG: tetratricopeptide repeat protein, partial [Flammeovirgaceae bacterium]|nr:tetratricopeptide repeat protein [Flammeovirgaceae bacterium]